MSDDNLERITILLQAKDRDFARAMDRNNKLVAKLSRDSDRNLARMNQRAQSHFGKMGQSAANFGRNFAAGLAGGAITAATGILLTNLRSTVSGIAAVGDQARRSGLGAEAFQEWAFVAQQNRIGVDQLVDGFKELNLRADEFIVTGGGAGADAFARLGYGANDLASALEDPSELMLELLGRMQNLDRAGQIRVADELLGGAAGERFVELLAQGEGSLRRTIGLAHDVGAVFEEEMIQRATILDQKFSQLTTRVSTFLQTAAVGLFAGGVETSADSLERMFGTLERARAVLGGGVFDALISETAELSDETDALLSGIASGSESAQAGVLRVASGMADVTGQLSDLGLTEELLSFDEVINGMEQLVADLRAGVIVADEFDVGLDDVISSAVQALAAVDGINGVDVSDAVSALATLVSGLRLVRAEADAATGALPGGGYGMTTGTPLTRDGLQMIQDLPTTGRRGSAPPRAPALLGEPPIPVPGGGTQQGYAAAVAEIRDRTTALELEAAALVAVADGGVRYGDAVEYAQRRAELLHQAMTEGREITPELESEINGLAEAYVTAGQSAEDAADSLERIREDARRGEDAAVSLFEGIVQGGDAARQAVARLLAEMGSSRFRLLLQGLSGSGGGWLAGLGGLISGKRAAGGPVVAGQAYRINENTPNSEIMVPSRSGGVLNVAQAKDALRGQSAGPSNVYHIDARGAQIGAAEQIEQAIRRAQPGIVRQSVKATFAASREVRFE